MQAINPARQSDNGGNSFYTYLLKKKLFFGPRLKTYKNLRGQR